jgi:hypothetical protein
MRRLSSIAVVLGTTLLGALMMAPFGHEIRDGGPGCTTCGTWTVTLMGVHVRHYTVLHLLLGAGVGFLAGVLIVVGWRLGTSAGRARTS